VRFYCGLTPLLLTKRVLRRRRSNYLAMRIPGCFSFAPFVSRFAVSLTGNYSQTHFGRAAAEDADGMEFSSRTRSALVALMHHKSHRAKRAAPRFNLEMASAPGGKRHWNFSLHIRNKKCARTRKINFNRWGVIIKM
jgi:hypothetical protein